MFLFGAKGGFIKKVIVRIAYGVLSIFLIMTITFFLFELLPGEIYNTDTIKNEVAIRNIIAKYSLNKPILQRYATLIKNTILFDFGDSYYSEGKSVSSLIAEHFPTSAIIGFISLIVIIIASIPLSLILKSRGNRYRLAYPFLVLLISMPTFVVAVILQFLFCVRLKMFSVLWNSSPSVFILPIISLSIFPIVFITKLLSSRMNEIMDSDYVLSARGRGVGRITIEFGFILRNSFVVIISYLAPLCASLVVGSYAVETIFNIPGLGRYFISSISNRDYPMVMGLTAFYAILLIMVNIGSDLVVDVLEYRGYVNEKI